MPEDDKVLDVVETTEETTEEAKPQEHKIPKYRFDEVNNKYKEYAELGLSPADIREMAADYRALVEKSLAREESGAKPTKQSTMDDARKAELRAGLLEVMPELAEIEALRADVKKTKVTASITGQQQLLQINERASSLVGELFEAEGFSLDKQAKLCSRLEDVIANDIYTHPEKAKRFYRGDLSVVRETYKEYAEDFLTHVVKPAKQSTKDLASLSGKKGLSLPATPLDDKINAGKPLTRDEQRQMHSDVFALMQQSKD